VTAEGATADSALDEGTPRSSEDGIDPESGQPTSRANRGRLRSFAVPLTVCLLVALYLIFLLIYAVDVPRGDDGLTVLVTYASLHGHFNWESLYAQHFESRVFVPNLIFLALGFLDHLDFRTAIFLSALLLVGAFLLLLRLFRVYLNRPLTVLPVLLVGLVWFSLLDVGNALWAFQIGWYLVLFSLIAIPYLLLVSRLPRSVNLLLAIAAAAVATFSALQGAIAWPEGLFLVVWATPWGRRTLVEVGCWLLACALTVVAFLHGYSVKGAIALCPPSQNCTLGHSLEHPFSVAKLTFWLVGLSFRTYGGLSTFTYEVIGAILTCLAVAVLVVTFPEWRPGGHRIPVPATLLGVGLLFDVWIALGRLGFGNATAGQYAMPQTIVLAGLIIFAVSRLPSARSTQAFSVLAVLAYAAIALIVVTQTATATDYGVREAAAIKQEAVLDARVYTNFSRIPSSERLCYETHLAGGFVPSYYGQAALFGEIEFLSRAHWSVFQPGPYREFRTEGPPDFGCSKAPSPG
jgi:hypothetical protein